MQVCISIKAADQVLSLDADGFCVAAVVAGKSGVRVELPSAILLLFSAFIAQLFSSVS